MPTRTDRSFDDLIAEATSTPIQGWDFSFLHGRIEREPLPWDYPRIAAEMVAEASRVCDIDTGGGELLKCLRPPHGSVAVEPYPPNVGAATEHLAQIGVTVVPRVSDSLPLDDEAFDLVLNRHGALHPGEMHRVLRPEGWLLTQQVGARNDAEFNEALGLSTSVFPDAVDSVENLVDALEAVGFAIHDARQHWITVRYLDIGAVVFQLRMVPWQAPGFDVELHRPQLARIHERIVTEGGFRVRSQRFLVRAQKIGSQQPVAARRT